MRSGLSHQGGLSFTWVVSHQVVFNQRLILEKYKGIAFWKKKWMVLKRSGLSCQGGLSFTKVVSHQVMFNQGLFLEKYNGTACWRKRKKQSWREVVSLIRVVFLSSGWSLIRWCLIRGYFWRNIKKQLSEEEKNGPKEKWSLLSGWSFFHQGGLSSEWRLIRVHSWRNMKGQLSEKKGPKKGEVSLFRLVSHQRFYILHF